MRRLLTFVVVLLALTECGSEGNAENPFQEHNPDYRTRAGTFYEKAYLPGATKGLICVFAPQEMSEKRARQILRQFIYTFLDQYIADGGAITRRNHARILARLDSRVKELADGPSILKNYEAWKSGSSKKFPNPLAFLTKVAFQSPPVMLTLNRELQQQGWSVQSMESLQQTGNHADTLGLEPYQVFILHRETAPSREGDITLLVYRLKHATDLLAAVGAHNGKKPAARIRLFWRTSTFLSAML